MFLVDLVHNSLSAAKYALMFWYVCSFIGEMVQSNCSANT